ncbi:MAG TPA: hypothetical protein VNX17_05220, partial [Edaphobacter sp.]|nr:hypothetical protein [Edaphobacter sp.]
MRDAMKEFEMLLNDVLHEVANPEPVEGLKQRVMMRMEMAAAQSSELESMAKSMALFEEKQKREGVLASLWSSLRELVRPNELPPLVLESRPVAVVDRMAAARSYRSTLCAVGVHVLAILLIGILVKTHVRFAAPVKAMVVTDLSVPPQAPPKLDKMGGGGGQRGPTPVTKGTPPKFADTQIVPPNKPPLVEPKIHIEPTIEVQQDVKMASSIPQIGIASSPLVGMSMGNGSGTGLGSGNGSGLGPGSGGNTGGGPRRIGGGVSAPVLIYSVEPEFSEEAR